MNNTQQNQVIEITSTHDSLAQALSKAGITCPGYEKAFNDKVRNIDANWHGRGPVLLKAFVAAERNMYGEPVVYYVVRDEYGVKLLHEWSLIGCISNNCMAMHVLSCGGDQIAKRTGEVYRKDLKLRSQLSTLAAALETGLPGIEVYFA